MRREILIQAFIVSDSPVGKEFPKSLPASFRKEGGGCPVKDKGDFGRSWHLEHLHTGKQDWSLNS
jgi:hypothetical protein